MRIKTIILAALLMAAWTGTPFAGECETIKGHIDEAVENIVHNFKHNNIEALKDETDNLIFWDAYIQIECKNHGFKTPIHWLSKKGNRGITPYGAGFLFWLEDTRQQNGIEMTPAGLVRGRSF
jgi:hypothetical protein